jgi:DNA polymerase-3 subunit delta
MSFQVFLHELEKGLPLPVYLFYGSEPFLHEEAIQAIKGLIPVGERDFNLNIFDLSLSVEETIPFDQILDVANTFSFFGKRRFIVLKGNLQKLSKKALKSLETYISNPSTGSVFVILHEGVFKKEMREKFRKLKPVSLDIRESEIPYWIKQRAVMKGIEISNEAADYLIGFIGPDLGLLSAEIGKISLLGKKRIDVDDISDIIAGGRLYSIFDLTDALKEKDTVKVFKIYKALKDAAEDYSLIGALNWQYGRNLLSAGRPKGNEYLFRLFELLNMADIDIKSSGRTFPMEYLLIKLLRLEKGSPGAEGHSPFW